MKVQYYLESNILMVLLPTLCGVVGFYYWPDHSFPLLNEMNGQKICVILKMTRPEIF
jgi:hypothetical protein